MVLKSILIQTLQALPTSHLVLFVEGEKVVVLAALDKRR